MQDLRTLDSSSRHEMKYDLKGLPFVFFQRMTTLKMYFAVLPFQKCLNYSIALPMAKGRQSFKKAIKMWVMVAPGNHLPLRGGAASGSQRGALQGRADSAEGGQFWVLSWRFTQSWVNSLKVGTLWGALWEGPRRQGEGRGEGDQQTPARKGSGSAEGLPLSPRDWPTSHQHLWVDGHMGLSQMEKRLVCWEPCPLHDSASHQSCWSEGSKVCFLHPSSGEASLDAVESGIEREGCTWNLGNKNTGKLTLKGWPSPSLLLLPLFLTPSPYTRRPWLAYDLPLPCLLQEVFPKCSVLCIPPRVLCFSICR